MNVTFERNNNNSCVRNADSKLPANDGKRIRNILIFDNDPASLRLVRDLYIDSAESTLSQYYLLIVAFVILALAFVVVMF